MQRRTVLIASTSTDYMLTYDAFGNVLTIKAGNYTLATYEYAGNNGKLLKLTYGNGDYEEYVYDELERLISTKLNGVTEYVVKYDNNGRLYSLTEDGATHIYEYDSLDRLIRAWQEDGNGNAVLAVENSYDELGRAKGSEYVVGDRTMAYDITYKPNSNLVNYISMPVAGLQSNISYTYDEFERVIRKQNSFSNSLNFYEQYEYYSYTDENEVEHTTSLVSSLSFGGNTSNTTSAVYSYTYDSLGNIKTVKKNGSLVSEYSYDSLGQLISEYDNVNNMVYSYTYDKAGNIVKKTVFDNITSESYDINYTYNNSTWGDLLTAYNGTAITYDAIGNPTKWRDISAMTWEGRELQSATVTAGPRVTYEYNSDGIRTKKSLGGVIEHDYTLDGSKILSETVTNSSADTTYTLYYLYDESGSVQGFIYNNQHYYFQKNLQGDVIRILNNYATVVVEYTYDAWGNVLTTTGSLASTVGAYNPFRYRGYYYDSETGFYYVFSRYYDSKVGRWVNADVSETLTADFENFAQYNLYTYCFNNSANMKDNYGTWPSWNDIKEGFNNAVDWVNDKVIQPVVGFVEDVVEDFNNYDSNNQSEDVVFSSNYFSNYKGALVIKTPFDASFSFGFIGLSSQQQNANTLKHEYGHTVQMKNMGIRRYITDVAIPSITINILDRKGKLPYDYYSYPWEAEANDLGGAELSQSWKPPLPEGGYTSYWDLIPSFTK